MRHLAKKSQSIMSMVAAAGKNIEIHPGFSGEFWIGLVGFLMFIALVWYIGLIDGLYPKTAMTLLVLMIPLSLFLEPPSSQRARRQARWVVLPMVSFLLFALIIAASDKWTMDWLGRTATMVVVSSPFAFICLILGWKKPLLGLALVPSVFMALLYSTASMLPPGTRLDYMLIFLPAVLVVGIPWTILGYVLLNLAKKFQHRSVSGPGLEIITMAFLFTPLLLLIVLVVRALTSDDIVLALAVAGIGVMFSSIVSKPLRQLLLVLGDLSPDCRHEQNDMADSNHGE